MSYRMPFRLLSVFVLVGSFGFAQAPTNPAYGHVPHPTSTSNVDAQKYFEQGLALYYGFNHEEAVRSFTTATKLDPNMTMAWWGIAISLGPNYNSDVDPEREKQAYDALQSALQHEAAASAQEKDYESALAKRYTNDVKADYQQLSAAYSQAMRELSAKYPDDLDAATLYAESMMDLRPWRLWAKDGTPAPGTEEIVSTLESVLKRDPQHIGANHLYIHAVEASQHPERALKSAEGLAAIAPAAGHLVHMPGHIFIRTGYHEKSLETNRAAATMDEAYFNKTHAHGVYTMYYVHNLDFITTEATLLGRRGEAMATAQKIYNVLLPHVQEMPMVEPALAKPALVAARFHDWDQILKMAAPAGNLPMSSYLWRYARAMAFASTRQAQHAMEELAAMRKLAPEASKVPLNSVVLTNSENVVKIADHTVEARMAQAREDSASEIEHLRQAVALQDQMDYNEPPEWLTPVRESLGGALLRAKRAAEAETVFREDLQRNANNGRSLFGLAESLRAQKKPDSAARADFQKAWQHADVKLNIGDL